MPPLIRWIRLVLLISVPILSSCVSATKGDRVPEDTWLMYENPKDAGFSSEMLARAREYWESTESAAVMVVRDGAVVVAWGDVDRRFMLHSVRKSILTALYGIQVGRGNIDLELTLEQLGIDDINPPLSAEEKQAKVIDLLRARSGVYHPAIAEPQGNPKPPRGSHPPGTHWCYNGWDFNALGTILEQVGGLEIFDELEREIAGPLGMQDYRVRDGHYEQDRRISIHPSYPIRMSARDLARFGLLYLNGGFWGRKPILSEDWVRSSTSVSSVTDSPHGDYGYLWWVANTDPFQELGMASALGVGEQSIDVIPGAGLVVVTRTDTYANNRVSGQQRIELLRMILEAATSGVSSNPRLVHLPEVPREWTPIQISNEDKKALCGTVVLSLLGASDLTADIVVDQGDLVLNTPLGQFGMLAVATDRYMLEDVHEGLYVERNGDGSIGRIRSETEVIVEGYRHLEAGRTAEAIAVFEEAVDLFPYSFNCHDSLGEAYMASGDKERAIRSYERSLELNPNNVGAEEILGKRRPAAPTSGSGLEEPETAAGRCVAEFFVAYNAGDDESFRSFLERFKTKADLEERPLEERVGELRAFRRQFDRLEPMRFVRQTDRQAIVLVRVPRTGEGLAFRFEITDVDPIKLGAIKIRGPIPLDAEDAEIIERTDR